MVVLVCLQSLLVYPRCQRKYRHRRLSLMKVEENVDVEGQDVIGISPLEVGAAREAMGARDIRRARKVEARAKRESPKRRVAKERINGKVKEVAVPLHEQPPHQLRWMTRAGVRFEPKVGTSPRMVHGHTGPGVIGGHLTIRKTCLTC